MDKLSSSLPFILQVCYFLPDEKKIIDLNMKGNTLKLLGETTEKYFHDFWVFDKTQNV